MKLSVLKYAVPVLAGAALMFGSTGQADAAAHGKMKIKKGGMLSFVVGSKIPSYDGHIEGTFGMIHPIRPF